jgi:hypothetical protein
VLSEDVIVELSFKCAAANQIGPTLQVPPPPFERRRDLST